MVPFLGKNKNWKLKTSAQLSTLSAIIIYLIIWETFAELQENLDFFSHPLLWVSHEETLEHQRRKRNQSGGRWGGDQQLTEEKPNRCSARHWKGQAAILQVSWPNQTHLEQQSHQGY